MKKYGIFKDKIKNILLYFQFSTVFYPYYIDTNDFLLYTPGTIEMFSTSFDSVPQNVLG